MDIIIIGGGVVGLWTAIKASEHNLSVTIIEKHTQIGSLSSARNSGVLHAGIYYKNNSEKAFHCVRGHALTLDFLKKYNIPHLLCGKLIVAINSMENSASENNSLLEDKLINLKTNALQNDVKDLDLISLCSSDYPYLQGNLALHSKNTGVVCLKKYIAALHELALSKGVKILSQKACIGGAQGHVIIRDAFGNIEELKATYIVNAAGLYADDIASYFGLKDFEIKPNKGIFFQLKYPLPITKLIYPLPFSDSTHLGLHYTIDTLGNAYAGPNAQWADNKLDYNTDTCRTKFYEAFAKLIKGYKKTDLIPINKIGLRARLYKNNQPFEDFLIQETPKNVIHLLGIESPGLTSAPSLAEAVIQHIQA